MKITRRQLAMTVAAAAPALTLSPAAPSFQADAPDWDRMAREARMQSAQALARVDVPMLVEPAFQFKA